MKYEFDVNKYRQESKEPLKAGRHSLDTITKAIEKEIESYKKVLNPFDFQTYLSILCMQLREEITVQARQNGADVNIDTY